MPVNGIELKEGQRWRTQHYGIVTIVKPGLNEEYPWRFLQEDQEKPLSITDDGKYWSDDDFPILLELIKEPFMKPTDKFTPKPGDKIICNNGEEFICCTLEFLHAEGLANYLSSEYVFSYREAKNKTYFKYDWQYWEKDGISSREEYNIREVIPQESLINSKELLYTVEEVTEAFSNALHLSWLGRRQEGIDKVKDYLSKKHNTEYQEYLRLKAIYD